MTSPVNTQSGSARALRSRTAAAWLVVFAALFSLAVVLACGVSPVVDVLSPLLGHGVIMAISAALASKLGARLCAGLAGGAIAALLLHSALTLSPAPSVAATRAGALRVIALNTWHQQHDVAAMTRYLQAANADVVVLSELSSEKQAMLDMLRATYPHQISCAQHWPCSMALLSRFPISHASAERHDLDIPPLVRARIVAPQTDAPEITVIGTHIHRPSRNPWRHLRQLDALARIVRGVAGPVIVAGDFNSGPWSHGFQTFLRRSGLTRHALLTPTWPAWPIRLPQVALDHVLVSGDLEVSRGGTGPTVGSDHLPVWADVTQHPRSPSSPLKSSTTATLHLGAEFLADLGGEHDAARDLRR